MKVLIKIVCKKKTKNKKVLISNHRTHVYTTENHAATHWFQRDSPSSGDKIVTFNVRSFRTLKVRILYIAM